MNKMQLEKHVLTLAMPLLEKLYGKFSVDASQTDKPDAAICVNKPHKRFGLDKQPFRVGIEITTVDQAQDLAYLRDERHGKDDVLAQQTDALERGVDSSQPTKKVTIEITDSYIFDGAIRKKDKYQSYVESGTYREIILLCFSDMVATQTSHFETQLRNHTNHLLSQAQFPFDAVIFVSLRDGGPVRVYKKSDPLLVPPASSHLISQSTTIFHSPTMLFGREYNLNKIISAPPLIAPRQAKPAPKPKSTTRKP